MTFGKHVFVCFLALGAVRAYADERIRPNNAEQLEANKQTAVKVNGARVSYANYAALRRDFPQLQKMNEPQIDQWVLDNFAYINSKQSQFNGIRNSDIPVDAKKMKVDARPPYYGRAGVLEAQVEGKPVGLVDVKGLGMGNAAEVEAQVKAAAAANGDPKKLDELRTKDHSDGLMRHGEAIAELTRQTAVQRIYDLHNQKHGTDYQTVESYFVIELPFDVLGPNGSRDRAALYGRQAHWRGKMGSDSPAEMYSDPFGGRQASIFGTAVDFGGVLIEDPRLKAKFGIKEDGRPKDPQDSLPWIYGHQTADGFRDGGARAVYTHLEQMLSALDEEWKKLPPYDPKALPGKGGQKQYLEWGAIARKPRPKAEDSSEMITALKTTKHGRDLGRDSWLVQQMSPQMLKDLFGSAIRLRGMPMEAIAVAFPPSAHGDKDPQVKALLEAVLSAMHDGTILPKERVPFMALASALVERHFPEAERAAAVAPFEKIYVQKFAAELPKEFYGTRIEMLTGALLAKAPAKELFPLVKKELAGSTDRNLGSEAVGKLFDALLATFPTPETYDLVRTYYTRLDLTGRRAVVQHFIRQKDVPQDIVALLRQNLSGNGQKVNGNLLRQFWLFKDPTLKDWVVEQLSAPAMDHGSMVDLWQLALNLHASTVELQPAMVAALRNGTPTADLGMEMATLLLKAKHPEAHAAVDKWLGGLSGLQRRHITGIVASNTEISWVKDADGERKVISRSPEHAHLDERARYYGTRPTCSDGLRALRKIPKSYLWGSLPVLAGVGVTGAVLWSRYEERARVDQEKQACLDKRGTPMIRVARYGDAPAIDCVCQDGQRIYDGTCDERDKQYRRYQLDGWGGGFGPRR